MGSKDFYSKFDLNLTVSLPSREGYFHCRVRFLQSSVKLVSLLESLITLLLRYLSYMTIYWILQFSIIIFFCISHMKIRLLLYVGNNGNRSVITEFVFLTPIFPSFKGVISKYRRLSIDSIRNDP